MILLNTLYLTTPETQLYKEGETVVVKIDREKRLQVPIHHLQAIVCMGPVYLSPELMHMCLERDVAVSFLTERGRFLGRLEGFNHSSALLRVNQHRAHADTARSLALAKSMVQGKLANQRHILQRAAREAEGESATELAQAATRMPRIQDQVDRMETHDQVRGCEGEGASVEYDDGRRAILFQRPSQAVAQRGQIRSVGRKPQIDDIECAIDRIEQHEVVSQAITSVRDHQLDRVIGLLCQFPQERRRFDVVA